MNTTKAIEAASDESIQGGAGSSGSSDGSAEIYRDRLEKGKRVRESQTSVEGFIARLSNLGIFEARYLLRGYRRGELSPVEVYERGGRLLERLIIGLRGEVS